MDKRDLDRPEAGPPQVRYSRHAKSWMVLAILAAIGVLGIYLVPQNSSERDALRAPGVGSSSGLNTATQGVGGAVGTGGEASPGFRAGAAYNATGAAQDVITEEDPAVIKELETITGSVDGNELVGRRVDLHVDVTDKANDVAFWVGSPGNRVLVVLSRDTRDGDQRQRGQPSNHGISPVQAGQKATISGVVQRVPHAEARHSWMLTDSEEKLLAERPIYIRAHSVTTEGHGTR